MAARSGVVLALMLPVLAGPGCAGIRTMLQPAPQAPVVFESAPESSQLLATMRAHCEAVRQLESDVRITMDGLPTGIRGTLLVERPHRMRLKAGVLGMTDSGIDLGANEERFWIFNKSSFGGQTPSILFARHDEFRNSPLQRMIPLQPQWIIDALGLVDLDGFRQIEGPYPRPDGYLELRALSQTPAGTFHRLMVVDPRRGWLVQQAIYSEAGDIVAWSQASDFRYFPEERVSLPGHIELHLVGSSNQTTRLSVSLQSHTLNKLHVDPSVTWQMPAPADVPAINLSTLSPDELERLLTSGPQGVQSQARPATLHSAPRPYRMGQLRGFDLRP